VCTPSRPICSTNLICEKTERRNYRLIGGYRNIPVRLRFAQFQVAAVGGAGFALDARFELQQLAVGLADISLQPLLALGIGHGDGKGAVPELSEVFDDPAATKPRAKTRDPSNVDQFEINGIA